MNKDITDSDGDTLNLYKFTLSDDTFVQVSIRTHDGRYSAVNLSRKQTKALRKALKKALA